MPEVWRMSRQIFSYLVRRMVTKEGELFVMNNMQKNPNMIN